MSKQDLIDELSSYKYSGHLTGGPYLKYNEAIQHAISIINEHLEGKVIVPEEPTEAIISAAIDNGAEGDVSCIISDYKAMLSAAKEEK